MSRVNGNVSKPRILFVSHAATRNGATILLLNELHWLREHTDYELEILVNGGGELLGDFQAIGRTTVWRSPAPFLDALHRSVWNARLESQYLKLRLMGRSYDLVYFNTSAVASQVPVLARSAVSVLWHIHELEYALQASMGAERIHQLFPLATRFVVVSSLVRDVLVTQFKVPAGRVDLIRGCIPVSNVMTSDAQTRRLQIRKKFGWPDDTFVVGGCGAPGWRKGTDLFLQVAKCLFESSDGERTRFLWVGGGLTGPESLRFEHDLRLLGLSGVCQLIPTTAEVMDYYQAMDVFALTSREDPFPLVMLEAGACRLPVVCFEGSGGGPEFVGAEAGLVAPYLDATAFAKQVAKLRDEPDLRQRLGRAAAEKVNREHSFDVQGPKLLESIQRCLSTHN